jgi:hypothetical protein
MATAFGISQTNSIEYGYSENEKISFVYCEEFSKPEI